MADPNQRRSIPTYGSMSPNYNPGIGNGAVSSLTKPAYQSPNGIGQASVHVLSQPAVQPQSYGQAPQSYAQNPMQAQVETQRMQQGRPLYAQPKSGPAYNTVTGAPAVQDAREYETRQMTNQLVDHNLDQYKARTPIGQNYGAGLGSGVAPANVAAEQARRAQQDSYNKDYYAGNKDWYAQKRAQAIMQSRDPSATTVSSFGEPISKGQLEMNRLDYEDRKSAMADSKQNRISQQARFSRGLPSSPEEAMLFAMQRSMGVNPVAAMGQYGHGMQTLGENATNLERQRLANSGSMDIARLNNDTQRQANDIQRDYNTGMLQHRGQEVSSNERIAQMNSETAKQANEIQRQYNAGMISAREAEFKQAQIKNDFDRKIGLMNAEGSLFDRKSNLAKAEQDLEQQRRMKTPQGRGQAAYDAAIASGKTPAQANEAKYQAEGGTPSNAVAIKDQNQYRALKAQFDSQRPGGTPQQFQEWLASQNMYVDPKTAGEWKSGADRNEWIRSLLPAVLPAIPAEAAKYFGAPGVWSKEHQDELKKAPSSGYQSAPQPSLDIVDPYQSSINRNAELQKYMQEQIEQLRQLRNAQ